MILLDANLLVYASAEDLPQHAAARAWLGEALRPGAPRVGIPWTSLLAFVRLTTNPRVLKQPLALTEAWAMVESWLRIPRVWIPTPGEGHAAVLANLLRDVSRSEDVMDAHLAAIAVEHGLTLCSADRGFARFRGLRWTNPLEKRAPA